MDAPVYPPSQSYEAPRIMPTPMSTTNTSLAEFIANPQAMDILAAEVPSIRMTVKAPPLVPHLGNMSPRELAGLGAFKPEPLDRVDAKLKAENLMTGSSR